jgi:hypothetical protein
LELIDLISNLLEPCTRLRSKKLLRSNIRVYLIYSHRSVGANEQLGGEALSSAVRRGGFISLLLYHFEYQLAASQAFSTRCSGSMPLRTPQKLRIVHTYCCIYKALEGNCGFPVRGSTASGIARNAYDSNSLRCIFSLSGASSHRPRILSSIVASRCAIRRARSLSLFALFFDFWQVSVG